MGKEEENRFGLVYDGALTENIPGKVNIRPVKYELRGLKIAANVYVPADFDENGRYAAVVVAHPNGGVKVHRGHTQYDITPLGTAQNGLEFLSKSLGLGKGLIHLPVAGDDGLTIATIHVLLS